MKKYTKEQIELLLPDYIANNITDEEKNIVEDGFRQFPQLIDLYNQLKFTMDSVSNIKLTVPSEQYWDTLLPKINSKLSDNKTERIRTSDKLLWKILIPAAAILLIFIIYKLYTVNEPQLTEDKITEPKNIYNDSNNLKQNNNPDIAKLDKKEAEKKYLNIKDIKNKIIKRNHKYENEFKEDFKKESNNIIPLEKESEPANSELYADNDDDEVEIIYEESETEFNQLSDNDKKEVISIINKINL